MDLYELLKSVIPYVVGAIVGYLAYNHKRHDKAEKDILVLKTQMSSIKEDIQEIKRGVEKLVDRERK